MSGNMDSMFRIVYWHSDISHISTVDNMADIVLVVEAFRSLDLVAFRMVGHKLRSYHYPFATLLFRCLIYRPGELLMVDGMMGHRWRLL